LFDGTLEAGQHEVSWNGLDEQNRPVASGVYLIHLTAANQSYMHKIVYSK
jgi:flagellar hook assembly protein FlgD